METPRLEIFTGEVNEHLAQVYVRVPGSGTIRGHVRGPFNVHSQTLPTNYLLRDLGPGPTRLAGATVTDPCTWSPESPSVYDVVVESEGALRHDSYGIRRFGVVGENLFLNGKRWVLRGIFGDQWKVEWGQWREAVATRVLETADPADLREATRQGVMTLLTLRDGTASELQLAARFATAAIVVLPSDTEISDDMRKEVPNLVLGQHVVSARDLRPWADVAWVTLRDAAEFQRSIAGISCPVIAVRHGRFPSLKESRAAIDQLQADLAPIGQCAGYIV